MEDEPLLGETPAEDESTVEVSTTETTIEPLSDAQLNQIRATYDIDARYIISHCSVDFIVRMKSHPKDKDDLVSFCEGALQGNDVLLARIREFQTSYSANQAIVWLQEPFLSICITQIFKSASVETMYYFRILIRDVQRQLNEHQCTTPLQVYLSEVMPEEQLIKLKSLNGKIIAMKSFLLTNLVRETALSLTASIPLTNGLKRTLFIIEANPQTGNGKSFAKLASLGHSNDQNIVVFTIGLVFQVTEIADETNGINTIKLTLSTNDAIHETRQHCDQLKRKYINEQNETSRIRFGEFAFDLGKSFGVSDVSDGGKNIIHRCLEISSSAGDDAESDRLECYDTLGNIELKQTNFDLSLDWYKKGFDLRKSKQPENDLDLAKSYQHLANVSLAKKDSQQAREYLQNLVTTWKKFCGDDCSDLIFCYSNLAEIYQKENNPTEALVYYHRTLSIMTKHKYPDDDKSAKIYYNVGEVCTALGQYQIALGYYSASLEIRSKTCSTVDPTIAATYRGMGLLYKSMGNVQQAQAHLEKAAAIYRELYEPTNPIRVAIEESIQNLSGPDRD